MSLLARAIDRTVGSSAGRWAVTSAFRAGLAVRPSGALARARWTGHLLSGRGRHREAAQVLGRAERRATGDRRAEIAALRALAELGAGHRPADLDRVVGDVLAAADRALAGDDLAGAAERLVEALSIAYHPARHFGTEQSPLLADPDTFLAPFTASAAYAALTAGDRAAPPRERRPVGRFLVVTSGNDTFVRDVVADYRATPGVEVRSLDLAADPVVARQSELPALTLARLRRGVGEGRTPVPDHLAETFRWADTVLVEWGNRSLAWVSLLAGQGARVVGRIHRYEAMTAFPTLTDWSGVDDVVLVAEPIRRVVEATCPRMPELCRVEVVPNRADLARFALPKTDEAARTCALVGWNRMFKDPAWALEVLTVLRENDRRWRLLLVGDTEPADAGPAAMRYFARVGERIDALGDAVERTGFTTDVPAVLARAGVILSSSRNEGTHEALLQGAASGALPVVRDWPDLRGWGGAGAVYPPEWVVGTPQDAAARILAADVPHAGGAAREAQRWALENRDWSVVRPRLDAVVLGEGSR